MLRQLLQHHLEHHIYAQYHTRPARTETDEELVARELPVAVAVELREHGVELRAVHVRAEQRREAVEVAPLDEAAAARVAHSEQLVAALVCL